MMATQEQINAARRMIEQLRDQHANDVRKLVGLLESGAMKGRAADRLIEDCKAWDLAYRSVFQRALALVDSTPASPEPAKPMDSLGQWPGRSPIFPPGESR
ncbi:hypothetical protein [Nonomuraea candida]|uniref:hypothetical protein n=1 Tax=Nonomuraea candida TaxID=359159 RepID=UPI0005B9EF3B|nr:hypothetical protein [Nonomuraea candida]